LEAANTVASTVAPLWNWYDGATSPGEEPVLINKTAKFPVAVAVGAPRKEGRKYPPAKPNAKPPKPKATSFPETMIP